MEVKHLWEYEHPYYCESSDSYQSSYSSFDEYLISNSDVDDDLNFLFRWDWITSKIGNTLELYYILQRKAIIMKDIVRVEKIDEDSVRMFLESKMKYMKRMWEPI